MTSMGWVTVSVMGHPDRVNSTPRMTGTHKLIMLKSSMKISQWNSIQWILVTLKRNEGIMNQTRTLKPRRGGWQRLWSGRRSSDAPPYLGASPVLPVSCGTETVFTQPRTHSTGVVAWGWHGGTPPWGVYGAPAHSAAWVGAGSSKGSGTAEAGTLPHVEACAAPVTLKYSSLVPGYLCMISKSANCSILIYW